MLSKIPLGWTQHIRDPKTRENFEASVIGSHLVLDRLRDVLERQLEELERTTLSDEFLEAPNLDQRFYVNLGERKSIRMLLGFLTFNGAKTSG